jgi:hypothetical protein
MRNSLVILAFLFSSELRAADSCASIDWKASLQVFNNQKIDEEKRSANGICLIRAHLAKPEVATAVVAVLKSPSAPLFLKEDLVEALGSAGFRHTITFREPLTTGPISANDKDAMTKTEASAGAILAVAENVKTIKEVLPVSQKETEIVRALSEIVIDEESHVILRELAVKALAEITAEMRKSGVYSDHTLHVAYESLRYASLMPGEATYFIGAASAYSVVADAHNQILAGIRKSGRAVASEKKSTETK